MVKTLDFYKIFYYSVINNAYFWKVQTMNFPLMHSESKSGLTKFIFAHGMCFDQHDIPRLTLKKR